MKILIALIFVFLVAVLRGKTGHSVRTPIFSTLIISLLFVAFVVFMIVTNVPIENQKP